MKIRIVFIVFFVQILFIEFGYGQSGFMRPGSTPTVQNTQPESANSDNSGWDLPPLQTLIKLALENSPALKLSENEKQLGEYALKEVYRDWLKKISFVADARYGTMLDYSKMVTMPGVSPATIMMNYGVGAMASVSLSELFDRKRLKQQAKLRIEQSNIRKEDVINGVTQMVINAYYDVLATQKNFALANELNLTAALVHDKAKMDYTQNRISLADYAKENESFLSSQNNVELQRFSLMKSIHILEIIVGIELVKTN